MTQPVAFPTVDENTAAKRNKFQAGVRAYADDYYIPEYVPSDTDLLCAFRIEPLQGVDMVEASAAVAAESSTGTWTEVWSNQLTDIDYYNDACWLFGGGTHGHPRGSRAGARANRVATEAIASGKTLDEAARTRPELREVMDVCSKVNFDESE